MNLWYKKASVFVVAGVVYLAGQYFRGAWFVSNNLQSFCRPLIENGKTYCNSPFLNEGLALIDLGQMLVIVAVILLFANATTFRKWLKFSIFYIPIVIVLDYLIYPISFMPSSAPATYSQGVYPFGWLYVFITLGIVIWKYFATRRNQS